MIEIPVDAPILVVDDSEAELMIVETVLERSLLANPVEVCLGGNEALERMARAAAGTAPVPCLLLMDVNMPRTSGFDVLRELRAQEAFESIPVVMMLSSSDADEDRVRARALGADLYRVKASGISAYIDLIDGAFVNVASAESSGRR